MDVFFESLLIENGMMVFTAASFLKCFFMALALGIAIACIYMLAGNYRKQFVMILVILPALVQVMITLVNGNLGTGIAVMGAFSLVRFRSIPGSAREIGSIFFAMAAGLACGMGYLGIAVFFVGILGLVSILLQKSPFGEEKAGKRQLRITIPETLDYTDIFEDLFREYTKEYRLLQVKTCHTGNAYKLKYEVTLKNEHQEKNMVDAMRGRDEKIEILCSRVTSGMEEVL